MQALERTVMDTNWITLLLVGLLIGVFLLKRISPGRLKGNAFSIIKNNYIETKIENNISFFNFFQGIIFVFSMAVLSLSLYKIILFKTTSFEQGFCAYLKVLGGVFSYFTLKWGLEFLLSILFLIQKNVKFFLTSKSCYLYSVSFLVLIGLVLTEYSQLNTNFLIYFLILLFLIRFIIHVASNKKLIFSKLFYFILYLCTFEIAPLFILFKLLF